MPSTKRRTTASAKPRVSLQRILRGIRVFATDVDGVLTDAGMYYSKQTNSTKTEFIGPFPQNTYNKSSVSSISPVYPVSLFILFHFN